MLYFNDGEDIVQAFDGATVVGRCVHGPGVDDVLQGMDSAGGAAFPLTDGLGSLTEFESNGAVFMRSEYSPFGAQTSTYNPYSLQSPYGYTGREHDDETGLMFYRSRYYSPEQRRFTQEDKWEGMAYFPNSYSTKYPYVSNSPLNHVDPDGYWWKESWVYAEAFLLMQVWGITSGPRYWTWGPQNNLERSLMTGNGTMRDIVGKAAFSGFGRPFYYEIVDCVQGGRCDGTIADDFQCSAYSQDLADFMNSYGYFPGVKISSQPVANYPIGYSHDRTYFDFDNGDYFALDPYWKLGPLFSEGAPGTGHLPHQ